MNSTRTCDRCGKVVPAHAPDNLCIGCLFDTAEDIDSDSSVVPRPSDASGSAEKPPSTFGDYELLGELGRGGQGVVYRARHRGLARLVALKTIPPAHLAGTHARERFRLEASTASRLDHPNIVPIYEVGERDGFCFYSMKLVEGTTIQQLIRRGVPAAADCRHFASILVKIAHGVHHAHQRGVLHRDLKPSNILLDHEHEPHVSDFGLARQTDEDSFLTLSQALIGTPAYLAPEVAAGGARQATLAADVYGLGAILYQLLTGRPPFAGSSVAETLRALEDDEPVRLGKLNSAVPADLETICLKCLEKEPAKRYGTAQELADDLRHFLEDKPIHARAVTRVEHVWRWCRRNPALASFIAATGLLLLAILIGSPIAAFRIDQERQRAERGESDARQKAYASDMNLAYEAVQADDFDQALQLLNRHRPSFSNGETSFASPVSRGPRVTRPFETDLRGWEWRYLWSQCRGEELFILGEHSDYAGVGILADGKTVFSAGGDKCVRLWDFKSRRRIGLLPHPEAITGAAASSNGRWLATTMEKYAEGQPVLLWDPATQEIAASFTTITPEFTNFWVRPRSITFSPDNRWLAFATVFGGLRIWDVNEGSEFTNLTATTEGNGFLGVAFSPDSSTLAYNGNEYGQIVLWDVASRSVTGRLDGHQSYVTALAFSPDGQTLASGSHDRTTRLWNLSNRLERSQFTNNCGDFSSLAFAPDGRTLAMNGEGRSGRVIRLVDVETGNKKAELRGHLGDIYTLAFTADGRTLLSAGDDGTVRVWDPVPGAKDKIAHTFIRNAITAWKSYGPALCLSPDGRHLLTVYTNQTFGLWDTLRLAEGEPHPLPFTNTTIAAVAPGGKLAAFGSSSGELMLWDVETGRARFLAQRDTNCIYRLVFSEDSRYLAAVEDTKTPAQMSVGYLRRTIRIWDVEAQKETRVFDTDGAFPVVLTFSADAKALMVGFRKGPIKLWPLDRPGGPATFLGHSGKISGLVTSSDGQALISAEGESIRFWNEETRRENALELIPRAGWICSLALSRDGRRIAVGAADGRITIWDVGSHQEVATLEGHNEPVTQLAFTPDGDHLVSASKDQLRVWRAASLAETDLLTNSQ